MKYWVCALLVIVLVGFATVCIGSSDSTLNEAMVSLNFTTVNGEEISVRDILQNYNSLLLYFFSVDQDNGTEAIEYLQKAYVTEDSDIAIALFGVSNGDTEDTLLKLQKEKEITFPLATGEKIIEILDVKVVPSVYCIGKDFALQWFQEGSVQSLEEAKDLFKKAAPNSELEEFESENEQLEWTILFEDTEGNPVAGVMANLCTDTTCQVIPSDQNGQVIIISEAYPVTLHLLSVPSGYVLDRSYEMMLPESGGEVTVILDRTEE